MADEIKIPQARLVAVIAKALTGAGMPLAVAAVEAEVMVEADLCGVPSHGVRMLPALLQGIRDGRVTVDPQIKVVRERLATCVLDADNGPGRFVSMQAMRQAVERAERAGIGACLVTRVSHWGRAHAYAYRAAQAGMIGLCTTNAIPNMLAWGSSKPLLGNNPLAMAVPRGGGKEPIIFDMAMSQAAIGKIKTYMREGKKVPAGWGLDANGQPSEDPAVILAGGKILPFGDHKGAGLALFMELLTGALSGGLLSNEIAKLDATGLDAGSSKLFLALNISAFVEVERFAERVEALVAWLQTAEPGLVVTLPGEHGWQARERNLSEGIPIHPEIVQELAAVGVSLE